MPSFFDRLKNRAYRETSPEEVEAALYNTMPFNAAAAPPILPGLPPAPSMPMPARGNPGAVSGPPVAARQSRYEEINEARDAYAKGTPGRLKSAVLNAIEGALTGLTSGEGIGAGIGGAVAGGLAGGISPRGMREMEFDRRVKPKILERYGFEDAEAAQLRQAGVEEQNALMNRARLEDISAGVDVKKSQAERNRLPRPERKPPQRTAPGRGIWDPSLNDGRGGIIPGTEPPERPRDPDWRYDTDGLPYNLNDPKERKRYEALPRSKRVKLERPRAAKTEKKYASITDVRAAAEKSGMTESQMSAEFKRQGYEIVR